MCSSKIIGQLQRQRSPYPRSSYPRIAIAFFYAMNIRHRQNVRSLLGSFVKQLLIQQSPPNITAGRSLYRNCRELTPTVDLRAAFIEILEKMETSFPPFILWSTDWMSSLIDRSFNRIRQEEICQRSYYDKITKKRQPNDRVVEIIRLVLLGSFPPSISSIWNIVVVICMNIFVVGLTSDLLPLE